VHTTTETSTPIGRWEPPRKEIRSDIATDSPGLVCLSTSQTKSNRWRRGRIKILAAAGMLQSDLQKGGHRYRAAFITLTYPFDLGAISWEKYKGKGWEPKDITGYVEAVKKWLERRNVQPRYVWKLELTQRGVAHYHIIWFLPRGVTLPKPDKQGHWKKGLSRCEWARKPVGYLAKYCSKTAVGILPDGARLCGAGGLSPKQRTHLAWHTSPEWVKEFVPASHGVHKRRGGWWEDDETGWGYLTPWVVEGFGPEGLVLRYLGFTHDSVYIPAAGVEIPWAAKQPAE